MATIGNAPYAAQQSAAEPRHFQPRNHCTSPDALMRKSWFLIPTMSMGIMWPVAFQRSGRAGLRITRPRADPARDKQILLLYYNIQLKFTPIGLGKWRQALARSQSDNRAPNLTRTTPSSGRSRPALIGANG